MWGPYRKSRVHNANRKHVCRHCGKGFKCASHPREHELIHVNAKSKPYQCEICGSSFALRNYLHIHKRLSHERRENIPVRSPNKKNPNRPKKRKMNDNNNNGQSPKENEGREGGSSMDLMCHETLPGEN